MGSVGLIYSCPSISSLTYIRFCDEIGKDSNSALRQGDATLLKTFFEWIVLHGKEPQQAVTPKNYFRVLKMVYCDKTSKTLCSTVVDDVRNYIEYGVQGKKKSSPRPKPVLSDTDYLDLLHFIYAGDRT